MSLQKLIKKRFRLQDYTDQQKMFCKTLCIFGSFLGYNRVAEPKNDISFAKLALV